MPNRTFRVPNLSCKHCVMTIEREIGALDGVRSVEADEATKMVTVRWDEPPSSWQAIRDALVEIDYPPEGD